MSLLFGSGGGTGRLLSPGEYYDRQKRLIQQQRNKAKSRQQTPTVNPASSLQVPVAAPPPTESTPGADPSDLVLGDSHKRKDRKKGKSALKMDDTMYSMRPIGSALRIPRGV